MLATPLLSSRVLVLGSLFLLLLHFPFGQLSAGAKILASTDGIYLGGFVPSTGWAPLSFERALGRSVSIRSNVLNLATRKAGEDLEHVLPDETVDAVIAELQTSLEEGLIGQVMIGLWFDQASPPAFTVQDVIDGVIDDELRYTARAIAEWGGPVFWTYQREPRVQWPGYGAQGQDCRWGPGVAGLPIPNSCIDDGGDQPDPPGNFTGYGDPGRLDGVERYIDFHRHIHDVVESEIASLGLQSNITWVAGAGQSGHPEDYTTYFIGDDYIDWHAFTYYPGIEETGSPCKPFPSLLPLEDAQLLAPGKPTMLLEMGVHRGWGGWNECGDRKTWLTNFLDELEQEASVDAVLYWDSLDVLGVYDTFIVAGDPASMAWRARLAESPWLFTDCVDLANGRRICRRPILPNTGSPPASPPHPSDSIISNDANITSNDRALVAANRNTVTNSAKIEAAIAGITVNAENILVNNDIVSAEGIAIEAHRDNHLTNGGTIAGGMASVRFVDGMNTLELLGGSTIDGAAFGGRGVDTLMLTGTGSEDDDFIDFEALQIVGTGAWALSGNSGFAHIDVGRGSLSNTGALLGEFLVDKGGTLNNSGFAAGRVADDSMQLLDGSTFFNEGTIGALLDGIYAGDEHTFTNTGRIAVHRGIAIGSDAVVFNDGSINALGPLSVQGVRVSDNAQVGNAGAIASLTGTGLVAGINSTVFNTGVIAGRTFGLGLQTGSVLTNSGTIATVDFGLVSMNSPFTTNELLQTTIDDSAVSRDTGVAVTGDDSNVIVNSGLIVGGDAAIRLNGGYNYVILDAGSAIVGTVEGGAGTDVLVLKNSGFEDEQFTDFELVLMVGGEWTLSGPSEFDQVVVHSGVLHLNGKDYFPPPP